MRDLTGLRPDRVAIYIRWSTDEQTEGTTLATQRERCSLYVQSQGWQVNEDLIFIDEGHSGASLDRPALARLRERVKAGEVDCVVTYSMDRLSRSVADTVQLVQHEWFGKCVYRSATQPISTEEGNPTGQLIFNILASFAEFERALIRERTHSGLVRRAREGKYPGTRVAPFGYRRSGPGQLVIDSVAPDGTLQGPAAVVRRMFELAASGQGATLIARALAEEGIPAPTGDVWWSQVVRLMLRNPVYCGDLRYGRRPVNPLHRRDPSQAQRLPPRALAFVTGAVPAIVSRGLWEKSQLLFQDRAEVHTRKNLQARNRHLLSGIARCKCAGGLSIFYDRRKQRYYRCSRNFLSAGGCPCQPGVLRGDVIEETIIRAIRERYGSPALREEALATAKTGMSSGGREAIEKTLQQLEQRLRSINEEVARARRAARRGEIKLTTFEELKADAEEERREIEAQRAAKERALERHQNADGAVEDWEVHMAQVDAWDELDVTGQRQVLQALLRQIIIFRPRGSSGPPGIDLVWEMPAAGGHGAG